MSREVPAPEHGGRPRSLANIMPEDRRRFGVSEDWKLGWRRQVAWSDVDAFGHCNHIAYFRFFEDARNAYLEALGLPRIGFSTPGPVLAETEARYLKALDYGDEVLVTARTDSLRRSSFRMAYAVWRDGCHARGTALCVLMVNATGEKTPVPEPLRQAMIALDEPEIQGTQ